MKGRRWQGGPLVIASHNQGKVAEIADLLAPYGAEVMSAAGLGLEEPEETGLTFIDNALLKARAAAKATGKPALADDSGLAVAALNGDPGLYSARWAGPRKDFFLAMRKVEDKLAGSTDRRAAFLCALALVWPDGHEEAVEGRVDGLWVWPPRGGNGFGYDPAFQPDGYDQTFGEMAPEHKHEMSHRADAFRQLVARCFAP